MSVICHLPISNFFKISLKSSQKKKENNKSIKKKKINKFSDKHLDTCWNSHHLMRANCSKGKRVQPPRLWNWDHLITSVWIHPFLFNGLYVFNIISFSNISFPKDETTWQNICEYISRQRCRWYCKLWNDNIGREKIDQKLELGPLKLGTTRFDVLFKGEKLSYAKVVWVLWR